MLYFPERVADGTLPSTGFAESRRVFFYVGETERVFGIKFKSSGESIRDLAAQYIDLLSQSKIRKEARERIDEREKDVILS
jgi:hypothetical protein